MSYKSIAEQLGISAWLVADIHRSAKDETLSQELPSRVRNILLSEGGFAGAGERSVDPQLVAKAFRENGAAYFLKFPNLGRGSLIALVRWLRHHGQEC